MDLKPFRPHAAGSQTIAPTGSSGSTALNFPNRTQYVLTTPATNTAIVYIEFGVGATTATVAASYPLLPGMKEVISAWGPANAPDHVGLITGSGTQSVIITAGAGN